MNINYWIKDKNNNFILKTNVFDAIVIKENDETYFWSIYYMTNNINPISKGIAKSLESAQKEIELYIFPDAAIKNKKEIKYYQ